MTNLAKALKGYQAMTETDGATLARKIGIEESTLTRIKQGKMPNADGFAKIILWLVSK